MGTNFYLRKKPCECCKRFDEIHVGKSSTGWRFLFHADKEHKTFQEWKDDIINPDNRLYDEYNREISKTEWFDLIKTKKNSDRISYRHGEYPDGDYDFSDHEFS